MCSSDLTAQKVIAALQSQSAAVRAEFDKLTPTVADNITVAKNSFQQFIAELNKQSGTTSTIGKFVAGVGGIFESLAIDLELSRKEAEKNAPVLYEVGSAARESEARIRELVNAQSAQVESSSAVQDGLQKLRTELQRYNDDLGKIGAGDLTRLAGEAGARREIGRASCRERV